MEVRSLIRIRFRSFFLAGLQTDVPEADKGSEAASSNAARIQDGKLGARKMGKKDRARPLAFNTRSLRGIMLSSLPPDARHRPFRRLSLISGTVHIQIWKV